MKFRRKVTHFPGNSKDKSSKFFKEVAGVLPLYCECVLILVLVEDALGDGVLASQAETRKEVLILVLVEDALGEVNFGFPRKEL